MVPNAQTAGTLYNRKIKMKLWTRASGALKDQNSLLATSLSRKTWYRNSDLEAAIIKATSHSDSSMDYKNVQRVFTWIRTSPASLKPLVRFLTKRMEKTRSWVVAIKGLMLMHGVFCSKNPAAQRIGRLPFDLSNFTDGHDKPGKMWGFNTFIRSYFSFLDKRSALLCVREKQTEEPMVQELARLQNLQTLLDMLIQIKPLANNMKESLINEAMDCVIIEIYEIYKQMCYGIVNVLMGIYSAGKIEATMTLRVLHKVNSQGEDLALFFEFCREFGVYNAKEVPVVRQVPESDIKELERIINGFPDEKSLQDFSPRKENYGDDSKAIVVRQDDANIDEKGRLKTIITDKWEVFEEDHLNNISQSNDQQASHHKASSSTELVPLDNPSNFLSIVPAYYQQGIPDLISFY